MLTMLLDMADQAGVTVLRRPLGEATGGGACVWVDGVPTIVLDPRLGRRLTIEVLAHELGHVMDGRPLHDDDDRMLAEVLRPRRERAADRHAAALLVDLARVAEAAAIVYDLGGYVTAEELAADLEVPVRLAELAVEQAFGHEITRSRAAQRATGVS